MTGSSHSVIYNKPNMTATACGTDFPLLLFNLLLCFWLIWRSLGFTVYHLLTLKLGSLTE